MMTGREKLLFVRQLLIDWRARMLEGAKKFPDSDVFLEQAASMQADIDRIDATIAENPSGDMSTDGGPTQCNT